MTHLPVPLELKETHCVHFDLVTLAAVQFITLPSKKMAFHCLLWLCVYVCVYVCEMRVIDPHLVLSLLSVLRSQSVSAIQIVTWRCNHSSNGQVIYLVKSSLHDTATFLTENKSKILN